MSSALIRPASFDDLEAMLALAEERGREYALFQPVFWRPAPDALDRQRSYFVNRSNTSTFPTLPTFVAGKQAIALYIPTVSSTFKVTTTLGAIGVDPAIQGSTIAAAAAAVQAVTATATAATAAVESEDPFVECCEPSSIGDIAIADNLISCR